MIANCLFVQQARYDPRSYMSLLTYDVVDNYFSGEMYLFTRLKCRQTIRFPHSGQVSIIRFNDDGDMYVAFNHVMLDIPSKEGKYHHMSAANPLPVNLTMAKRYAFAQPYNMTLLDEISADPRYYDTLQVSEQNHFGDSATVYCYKKNQLTDTMMPFQEPLSMFPNKQIIDMLIQDDLLIVLTFDGLVIIYNSEHIELYRWRANLNPYTNYSCNSELIPRLFPIDGRRVAMSAGCCRDGTEKPYCKYPPSWSAVFNLSGSLLQEFNNERLVYSDTSQLMVNSNQRSHLRINETEYKFTGDCHEFNILVGRSRDFREEVLNDLILMFIDVTQYYSAHLYAYDGNGKELFHIPDLPVLGTDCRLWDCSRKAFWDNKLFTVESCCRNTKCIQIWY